MGASGAGPNARASVGPTGIAARDPHGAPAGSGHLVHLQFGAGRNRLSPARPSTGDQDRRGRKVRVLLCDGHRLFTEALAVLLESRGYEIVAMVESTDAAVAVVSERDVDVCVMELTFPDGSGLDGAARILRQSARTRIVLLTGAEHPTVLARALHVGARGIVAKADPVERLIDTIDRVHGGEIVLGDGDEQFRPSEPPPFDGAGFVASFLTLREREVLEHLAAGLSTVALTRALGVKSSTARTHIQNTLNKLGVHSKLEAVVFAVSHGLVPSPQARTAPARPLGVVQLTRPAVREFGRVSTAPRASTGGG